MPQQWWSWITYRKIFTGSFYSIISIIISIQILYLHCTEAFSIYRNRYTITILGIVKDPNFLSAYMTPCFIYLCNACFFNRNNSYYKILLLFFIFILFLAIFYTGSRAALLSIVVASITFIPRILKNRRISVFIIVVALFISVIVTNIFLIESPLYKRMFSSNSYTDNARLLLWQYAMTAFIDNPLIGSGHLSGAYYVVLNTNGKWLGTHSCFVDIITGVGLMGSLIVLLMYISMINVKKGNKLFILSMMLSFFAPLFFVGGYYAVTFWMPMVWCKVMSNCCKKEHYCNLLC